MINNLTKDDELFIKCLMADITKNLCECECDCKDKECSIFERLFIARQLLENNLIITQNEKFYYIEDGTGKYIAIETLDTLATGGTTYALSETEGLGSTVLDTSEITYYHNGIELAPNSIYKKNGNSYELAGTIYGYAPESYSMTFDCVEWNTISARINNNYEQKNKFVDPSRKKLLSGFYMDIHGLSYAQSNTDESLTLDEYLLGGNAEYVMTNCIDECCR